MRGFSSFIDEKIETEELSNSHTWGFEPRKYNSRIPVLDNYTRLHLFIGISQNVIPKHS